MGLCRLFLWLTAASSSGISDIAPQTWIWGIVLTGYIIGISLFARGESKKEETPKQFSILLLFGAPLTRTCWFGILEPTRSCPGLSNQYCWPLNWMDCLLLSHDHERTKKGGNWNRCIPLTGRYLRIDATAVCFYSPILITPVLCCLSVAVIMQKKFAAT